jgi:hypothetical protein
LRESPATVTVFAMARPLATPEHEIRALGTADKEALLRVLWEELDGPPDTEVESAWLAEAQRP